MINISIHVDEEAEVSLERQGDDAWVKCGCTTFHPWNQDRLRQLIDALEEMHAIHDRKARRGEKG